MLIALISTRVKACPTCAATYGNDVAFCPRDGAALRSAAGIEPGSVIGKKYEIMSEIGRGGMGVVYRARHLIWNEERALKVLTTEGAGVQQGIKGLVAEAQVMRKLQHPHIVRVEDVDYTEDGQPFVIMEYVEGQSLRQRLQSTGALGTETALRIAAETCSALSAAHQKRIVHRDIKPQNLLLAKAADGAETVKVIDFGIAKVREEAGLGFTGMMTGTTGFFVGTPEYASPEQAQGMRGSELDGRTDLYSLGLVLYEMLTGQLPFGGSTPVGVLVQRLQVPPAPLDRARPGLSFGAEVSGLVMKALERERENRYRSAEEMERAIAAVLESRRAERERAETARLAAERRRREEAETSRLAAEAARREQQERDTAAAALAAARERAERERQARQAAASARAAESERAGPPDPEHKRSATTVPGRQRTAHGNRAMWLAAGAALLALLGIGLAVWVSKPPAPPPAPAAVTQPGAEARLALGRELLRIGDYAGAIMEFKAVLESDPGNTDAQAALRDAQSAREAAQNPAGGAFDATGTLRQANEKLAAGMYADAIKLYQSVLAHDATNRVARRGLEDSRSARDAEEKAFGNR